ncbi:TSC22 domain family protein 4-like [Acanthaster planci]|uniref:TSC22 domain family protein 4-like n=1 Tax=Acanthaster planci TaxID=133434 RepID=A0A8B7YPN1_ACAPL|nr:TSC22 domain family protein 4-like [Acanthaster planci]
MEKTDKHPSNPSVGMRKEVGQVVNSAGTAAVNKFDPDEDPELQYLDQDKMNNSKKKSFFQITSVTENVNDENDSMDELDESRADDLSTTDLSKLSLQTDMEQSESDDSPNPPGPGTVIHPNAAMNPNVDTNGNGPSRFKLVKVARIEPIKRGRWTCKDFPTEPQSCPESAAAKTEQIRDNVSGSSSAASSVHYVPGENPPTENPLGDANPAPQQLPPPSIDNATKEASAANDKDSSSVLAAHRPSSKSDSSKESLSKKESSAGDLLSLDSLNVEMLADNQSENDESTSATGGAIDNKIEQAMDLVKSHLLFAVREEVEVLKEQIKGLLEKNEQLQRENNLLRQKQSQALPPHLPYSQSEAAPPHVGAGPPAGQDQGGFPTLTGPAAPRVEGYQPGAGEQPPFAGLQPLPGAAPAQQQTLPQQQAGQFGHLQQAAPQQQPPQLTLPQQTSTQLNQPPSQT